MPVSKDLENRVHEIMTEAIPEIRVALAEMSGKQDRTFEKLESLEVAVMRHVEVASESNKIQGAHAVRLASIEQAHQERTKIRDRWRAWAMGIGASIVTVLIVAFLKSQGYV